MTKQKNRIGKLKAKFDREVLVYACEISGIEVASKHVNALAKEVADVHGIDIPNRIRGSRGIRHFVIKTLLDHGVKPPKTQGTLHKLAKAKKKRDAVFQLRRFVSAHDVEVSGMPVRQLVDIACVIKGHERIISMNKESMGVFADRVVYELEID